MDTNKLNYRGKYSVINGTEIADVNAREAILDLNTSLENVQLSIVKTEDNKDAIRITINDKFSEVPLPEASLINGASFNQETHELTIVLANGENIVVNLGDLVDTYSGVATETTETSVVGGKISVNVKNGSIKRNLLSNEVIESLDSDKFIEVDNISLNTLNNGNFIVTNSLDNPCSLGVDGILRATKVNENTFTQTWTTSLGEALRVVTKSGSENEIVYSGDWYKQTFNIDDYLLKSEKPTITTVTETDLDSIFTGGWTVNFVKDDNCKEIVYYKTKDFIAEDMVTLTAGEKYCTYDKDTKKKTYYEDGQANFIVYFKNGYTVDQITVEGTHGEIILEKENIPGELDSTGNAYNVTKVKSDLTIRVTSTAKSATPEVTE